MKKATVLLAILCVAVLLLVGCVPQEAPAHTHSLTHTEGYPATCTDNGITENWFCLDCGKRFSDAEATTEITFADIEIIAPGHTDGEDDGDCTTAIDCTVCGEVAVAGKSHTAGEDDGDCTTAVACTECKKNAVEAKDAHTGGEATCAHGKLCEVCGKEYTERNPDNHADEEFDYADNGDGSHTKYYAVCGIVVDDEEAHSYAYTVNGDGTHTVACLWCDETVTGAHAFLDGACTTCGVTGGYCGTEGENAAWTLKDGAFTLYGTGEVYTYGLTKYPWHDYRRQIESIAVKDGITNIPEWAFYHSTVKTVTVPGSVTTIEDHAFYFCDYMESITLSEGLQSIGGSAFGECSALESITIPASVTYIDSYAFSGADIKEFRVAEGNAVYSAMDGNLYSTDGYELTLVKYAIASENTAFVTPAGVTVIGDYAFEGADNLEAVTVSADVRRIGMFAFQNCYSLREFTVLSTYLYIDDPSYFKYFMSLETVNFAGTQEQWDELGIELPEGVTVNCNYVPEA